MLRTLHSQTVDAGWLEALGTMMCHVGGDLLTCDTREDLTKRGNRSCVLGEVVRAYCTC